MQSKNKDGSFRKKAPRQQWSPEEIALGRDALKAREKLRRETERAQAGLSPERAHKRKRGKDHFKYTFPIDEKTQDPVQQYVLRQAWHYGLACAPGLAKDDTPAELLARVSQRTEQLMAEIMGEHAYELARVLNMKNDDLYYGVYPLRRRDLEHSRRLHLGMLVHLSNLKDYVFDLERELWVTMQMLHDERLMPVPNEKGAINRRAKYKAQVRYAKATGKKPPPPPLPPVALPTRIIAKLTDTVEGALSSADTLSGSAKKNLSIRKPAHIANMRNHLDPERVARAEQAVQKEKTRHERASAREKARVARGGKTGVHNLVKVNERRRKEKAATAEAMAAIEAKLSAHPQE